MEDKIIIKTDGEENSLIPDKWILGTGLSTDDLYVVHTTSPFMIVQCPLKTEDDDKSLVTIYLKGEIEPANLNRLLGEAFEIVEIYRSRLNMISARARQFLTA